MAEPVVEEREGEEDMAACKEEERRSGKENVNRKEKRKAMKKKKRKLIRKEIAVKEREEEEGRLNDPDEQLRLRVMEQKEAERMERERKEFEEREKAWIEAMKKKEAEEEALREEEESIKALEASREHVENESEEDDDWEYVEEGQPEIIWKGNEIIFKKKMVKVPKRDVSQQNRKEGEDRPTSNPLPPQSEAFADCTNLSSLSSQQLLESVAQQVPNFGTEQDKAHCPFHLKTGACRFGQNCSRVHFYPDKSCTLLMRNMYNGPGLACEQDEGLEYTDEEIERYYEEFYEDVHTEFLKFGEIVNFKVCRNSAFHLRGNAYVQYKLLDSALLAYNSVNGRYFAGKQVRCEFVSITRWKIAICGEYMKSGFKTCSRGTACNFIHCFHNPGRDYEWADCDRPPPRYWRRKMAALFGHSGDHDDNLVEQENSNLPLEYERMSEADSYRHHSRSSRSKKVDSFNHDSHQRSRARDHKRPTKTHGETFEANLHTKDNHRTKNRIVDNDSDEEWPIEDRHRKRNCRQQRHSSARSKDDKKKNYETDSDRDFSSKDKDLKTHPTCIGTSSRHLNSEYPSRTYESESEDSNGERCYTTKRHSSRHHNLEDKNTGKGDKLQDVNKVCSIEKRHGHSRRHSHPRTTGHYNDYETSELVVEEGDRVQEERRECRDYSRHNKKRDRGNGKDVYSSSDLTDDDDKGHRHHRKQRKRSSLLNRESEYSDDGRGRVY